MRLDMVCVRWEQGKDLFTSGITEEGSDKNKQKRNLQTNHWGSRKVDKQVQMGLSKPKETTVSS